MNFRKVDQILCKIKQIMNTEINVMDHSGYIVKSTETENIGEYDLQLKDIDHGKGIVEKENYLYFFHHQHNQYIVSVKIVDKETKKLAELVGFFLTEDFEDISKQQLIKDLLLSKITNEELENYDKKINIDFGDRMQVILIKVNEDIVDEVDNLMTHIYPNDSFIKVNKDSFVFIKNNKEEWEEHELNIYEAIYSELFYEPKIGVGIIVDDIKDLALSYNKANTAIELGVIFLKHKHIYYYNDLGIPVLIKNIDTNDLRQLVKDMHYEIEDVLTDKELVTTILTFFENDLNISETAKKIFIHRNTLIYRLSKIYKLTGYDLKKFEDAVNFKAAMLIHDYLKEYR